MQTFHPRRPVYEAVQYLPGTNCAEVAAFIGAPVHAPGECSPTAELTIPEWEGTPNLAPGDWIFRGPDGSTFPVPAATLDSQFEPT